MLSMLAFGFATAFVAITVDTAFYGTGSSLLEDLVRSPVIAPLNNVIYNLDPKNLAIHGLHPYYQHLLANLPQLLGPALPLLVFSANKTVQLWSAFSGVFFLSLFRHQEARFLVPAVPLLLSSIRLPSRLTRTWLAAWIVFNVVFGLLMGLFHQGGVIPMQLHIAGMENVSQVLWWKTYSPPIWLLDHAGKNISTLDLMGMHREGMLKKLIEEVSCRAPIGNTTLLVAPKSDTSLDYYITDVPSEKGNRSIHLRPLFVYKNHVNLDDLDLRGDGLWSTIKRVVGRRGLALYTVGKSCTEEVEE